MTMPVSDIPGSIIGYRRNGQPIRLIAGGAPDDGEPTGTPTPVPPEPTDPPVDENGFPANTPVAEMTDKQAAAYWRYQSRKHENRVKSMADYEDFKTKAGEYEKLKASQMSDAEKAIEAAKTEARKAVLSEVGTKLVDAQFTALTAGRMDEARRQAMLTGLNRSAFLTADGDVNTEALTAFVDGIAPATAPADPEPPKPVNLGQGKRGVSTGASVESGAALFVERHKK